MRRKLVRELVFAVLLISLLHCAAVPAQPIRAQDNPPNSPTVQVVVTDLGIRQWEPEYTTQVNAGNLFLPIINKPSYPDNVGMSVFQPNAIPDIQSTLETGLESGIRDAIEIGTSRFEIRTVQNIDTTQQLANEATGNTQTSQVLFAGDSLRALDIAVNQLESEGFSVESDGLFSSNGARAYTSAIAAGAPNPFAKLALIDSRGTVGETQSVIDTGAQITIVNTVGDFGMYTQNARLFGLPVISAVLPTVAELQFSTKLVDANLKKYGKLTVKLLEIKIEDERTLIPGWAHGQVMTWDSDPEAGPDIRVRQYLGNGEWSQTIRVTGKEFREETVFDSEPLSERQDGEHDIWDDKLPGEDKLGIFKPPDGDLSGVDLSELQLNYISESTLDDSEAFTYVFSSELAGSDTPSIDVNRTAQLAFDSFFTWIALPSETFWVNLNPNEPDRIVDDRLGRTDAGRVMLEADLEMKRSIGKMIHPETGTHQDFWSELYDYVLDQGTSGVVCPTIRVWIVPGEVTVWATDDSLYIVKALLDVKMEAEYLGSAMNAAAASFNVVCPEPDEATQAFAEQLFRGEVLPDLIDEVNTSPKYQELRTVFYSRVIAEWYESRDLTHQKAFFADLIDRGDVSEWYMNTSWNPQKLYEDYLDSLTNGEFAVLKSNGMFVYVCWFGGVNLTSIPMNRLTDDELAVQAPDAQEQIFSALMQSQGYQTPGEVWLGSSFVKYVANSTAELTAAMPAFTLSSAPSGMELAEAEIETEEDGSGPRPHSREYIQAALQGYTFFSQGRYAEAISSFTKALEYRPDEVVVFNGRAGAYAGLGQVDKALDDLNRAIELDPDDPVAYGLRGTILSKTDRQAAFDDLNRAIELSPEPALAYSDRGNVYLELGDYEAALADFNQAIALDPDGSFYYLYRSIVYIPLAEWQLALDDLAEYARRAGDQVPPEVVDLLDQFPLSTAREFSSRGRVYYYLGQYENALTDLEHAITLDPGNAAAYGSRGMVYYDLGQLEDALTDLTQAVALGYDDPEVFRVRGTTYYDLRAWEDALVDLHNYARLLGGEAEPEVLERITELEDRQAALAALVPEPTQVYTLADLYLRFTYPLTWAEPSRLNDYSFLCTESGSVTANRPAVSIIHGSPQALVNAGLIADTAPEEMLDSLFGETAHIMRQTERLGWPAWEAFGEDDSGIVLKVYLIARNNEWIILAGRAPADQFDVFEVTVFEPLARSLEILGEN